MRGRYPRPLGSTQRGVLEAMTARQSGAWYPYCGWVFQTQSGTERVLDGLHRRGMVELLPNAPRQPCYRITPAGRGALEQR